MKSPVAMKSAVAMKSTVAMKSAVEAWDVLYVVQQACSEVCTLLYQSDL